MPLTPTTKTVADVALVVKRQFGDESGTQISDGDIIRWCNMAQIEIIRLNKLNQATASVSSVVGTDSYTLPAVSMLSIEGVLYDNIRLAKTTIQAVQRSYMGATADSGIPGYYYEWDDSLYVYPVPDAVATIKVFFIASPTAIIATTDALSVPDVYFETVVDYCLKFAYELDDDPQSVQMKEAQVQNRLTNLSGDESSYYSQISLIGDDEDL